jgi:SOS regulatory protein LexA
VDTSGLSRAQKEVLGKILQCAEKEQLPPTLAKIAEMRGQKSKGNVSRIANALKNLGLVSMVMTDHDGRMVGHSIKPTTEGWSWWKSQGHEVPDFVRTALEEIDDPESGVTYGGAVGDARIGLIPLLGRSPAGPPALREQDDSENISLEDLFRGSQLYMLQVTGDSMLGDHILRGDYVIVDGDAECRDGEIIAVRIDGEVTIKRLWHQDDTIHLESSNPRYQPIIVDRDNELLLEGKVIGVVRDNIKRGRRMVGDK